MNNIRMKTYPALLIAMAMLCGGCQSSKTRYQEPTLPDGQVALLLMDSAWVSVFRIDGVRNDMEGLIFKKTSVKLLPGEHELDVSYSKMVFGSNLWSHGKFWINAVAGQTYVLEAVFTKTGYQKGTVQFFIRDKATGKVVSYIQRPE